MLTISEKTFFALKSIKTVEQNFSIFKLSNRGKGFDSFSFNHHAQSLNDVRIFSNPKMFIFKFEKAGWRPDWLWPS